VIRVLIVAPVRLYREGLTDALRRETAIAVIGTAAPDFDAIPLVGEDKPDAVIVDAGAVGPSFVRELVTRLPELHVIAFAVTESPGQIVEWAEAGVAGFVTQDQTVGDLVKIVTSAARGELVCSPTAAAALLRRVRSLTGGSNGDAGLTRRETEIAQLIEQGMMNKEIAARLGIELATVKNHVHRILEKLGAGRRADAAAHIRRVGLRLRD
jgi:two-component system nitrate/nitrite response regulator NarL